MAKRGKRYNEISQKVDKTKVYTPEEALELVFETKSAKFVETVELAIRLGVDPRHADQQVRGTVVLPNGTGKNVKILAITSGAKNSKKEVAGKITTAKLKELAETKMPDLNAGSVEAAMNTIAGTARSMGIKISE